MKLISITELAELAEKEREEMWRNQAWEYDSRVLVLRHKNRPRYEVDLERCCTPGQVLNWIVQIKKKIWADDKVLADLIRALDDCLNLQGNMCSGGSQSRMDPKKILARTHLDRY